MIQQDDRKTGGQEDRKLRVVPVFLSSCPPVLLPVRVAE